MSDPYLTPRSLAPHLGFSAPTLRRAYYDAAERRDAKMPAQDPETATRDAALLLADRTPLGFLRWTEAGASEVLRAFGKVPPAAWGLSVDSIIAELSPGDRAAVLVEDRGPLAAVAEDEGRRVLAGGSGR